MGALLFRITASKTHPRVKEQYLGNPRMPTIWMSKQPNPVFYLDQDAIDNKISKNESHMFDNMSVIKI
jgi:hypothetical protein